MFERNCPICFEKIYHINSYNRDSAQNLQRKCKKCGIKFRKDISGENNPFFGKKHTKETKDKLSKLDKTYTKSENFSNAIIRGMAGNTNKKPIYKCWLEKYGKNEADKRLLDFKKKQSENQKGSKNPMYGKPSPQGSGNGWKGWYKNIFFRSLRELAYLNYLDENKISWISMESKDKGIPYYDFFGQKRNYFADFYLVQEKIIIEIKPKRLWYTPAVQQKSKAAVEHCKVNNLSFELIDPELLPYNKVDFLLKEGDIIFQGNYLEKFRSKIFA